MGQYEKLRRTILLGRPGNSSAGTDYPIAQTAREFGFSDATFCAIVAGMANAGFIDLNIEDTGCARVRVNVPHPKAE
jgi:hypothetical protein